MTELPFAAGQLPTDLSQGLPSAELSEEHSDELAQREEASGIAFGFCLLDRFLKTEPREKLETLTERARGPIYR